ncbi:MAG: lipopolysaccharide transport periplasmic protein LptA [Sulfurospirillaceae bacterium]|nr:lipopolysaccharide transport periplasmic protein LptA [Sulfurospirillaceae bacterium]
MRYIFAFLLASVLAMGATSQVEITADKFSADEAKKISVFEGNVKVTKEKDKLTAKKIVIDFDDKKQPLKYTATGDAKINMIMNNKRYYAEAEKLVYDPIANKYTLEKKAFMHEIDTDKKVYGDFVSIDQKTGRYEVDGKQGTPVKFIFKVEDKK